VLDGSEERLLALRGEGLFQLDPIQVLLQFHVIVWPKSLDWVWINVSTATLIGIKVFGASN
jgi:hypothetical protein